MSINLEKKRLRQEFILRRNLISEHIRNGYDYRIAQNIKQLIATRRFQQIFAYFSIKSEPDILTHLIGCMEVMPPIFAPAVEAKSKLVFRQVIAGQALEVNQFGIFEPPIGNKETLPTSQTLVIVPCIAVSATGDRLGYGGGYYDRYLSLNTAGLRLANVYDELVCDVPHEDHDVVLDGFCTESRIVIF